MKPCVYAILGFGGMGNYHLDAIQQNVPELQIKGIYDIRPEAVEKAKEKQVHADPSLDALLADRDVELVIIATPNNFHKDLSIQCLQSGKKRPLRKAGSHERRRVRRNPRGGQAGRKTLYR